MTEPTALDPNTVQQRASDPQASVWVSASAGTGKTKVLTDRVLSLMLAGVPPERILCLTFTRAAATEMSGRITTTLGRWTILNDDDLNQTLDRLRNYPPSTKEHVLARQLFARVLDISGGLKIRTIHSFCQSLLARFPLEAGIPPGASLMDERDSLALLQEAFDLVLLRAETEDAVLAEAFEEISLYSPDRGFDALRRSVIEDQSDFSSLLTQHNSTKAAVVALCRFFDLQSLQLPNEIIADACEVTDATALGRAAEILMQSSAATDQERGRKIANWLGADTENRSSMFEAYANSYCTQSGSEPWPRLLKRITTNKILKDYPDVAKILDHESHRMINALMHFRAASLAIYTHVYLLVTSALLEEYKRLKQNRSLLDYEDLILATAELLERDGGASWVLHKLDGGLDHILIDEAQDTNPDQWRVIKALSSEFFTNFDDNQVPRTVFAVGDIKQSIFSFQGAEAMDFVSTRDWFAERVGATDGRWRTVEMITSFRSTKAVLATVDAVFSRPEASDGVILDGVVSKHQVAERRAGDAGSVEVWPLLEASVSDTPEPWKPPVEPIAGETAQARLARLVAQRIHQMIRGQEFLPAKGREICPGDIMVLVRRRTSFVMALARALKQLDIPVTGLDRLRLSEHIAVMDLLAVARFVLLPIDDLTLATVLRSPLIGISEEDLFTLAHGRKDYLWHVLRDRTAEKESFADAYKTLTLYMSLSNTSSPFKFFLRMLSPQGGRKKFLSRLGPEADEPINEFINLAQKYESTHPGSLEGFLAWFEKSDVEIKRNQQDGNVDAIRIMTVHGAKGLEAPIVFLPDTTQLPKVPSNRLWWKESDSFSPLFCWQPPNSNLAIPASERMRDAMANRQLAEYRRLLYVAMTRAADQLIVCGWLNKKLSQAASGSWYDLIVKGLQSQAAPLGLEEIDDPALAAALAMIGEKECSARVLRVGYPQSTEVTLQSACSVPETLPLPDWALRPAPLHAPSMRPLAPSNMGPPPPARSPLSDPRGLGLARGRLIHRLLRSLPSIGAEKREAVAREWLAVEARTLKPIDREQIIREVLAVLAHPSLIEVFGSDGLAEAPVVGNIKGVVIAGQIDRMLVTPDRVCILDYKTDREPPIDVVNTPAVYLRQMAAYRALMCEIYPERQVDCFLVWTEGPEVVYLEDSLLAPYAP